MTKDWDGVQDVIKDLSFGKKKTLEEVKELMEQKYKFTASTRAYRMKLKEWGLLRHNPRRVTAAIVRAREASAPGRDKEDQTNKDSSETVESTSVEPSLAPDSTQTGSWQMVSGAELAHAEPTFMGLLTQLKDLQPSTETAVGSQSEIAPSEVVMDMLDAILNNKGEILEELILGNVDQINDPIGMPFESPDNRFYKHPALDQTTILQHPNQKLLDIACCVPSGPAVWTLMAYGAKSSKFPLGSDLALYNAIRNGRLYSVQALLAPGRSSATGIPGVAWTPLLHAVFWNVPDVLRYILKRGGSVHDAAPFPDVPGIHTALQICLDSRAADYSDQSSRQKRNEVLKMLLDAGANIHAPPPEGSSLSPFMKFIEPWQNSGYWSMKLSCTEMHCLGLFVKRGANLQAAFSGSPCAALSSNTFEHQALWHSSPYVSDLLASNFEPGSGTDGSSLLHEIINSCADAKRHPAEDTLRDIKILIQRGVDPNLPDAMGFSPLRKSLELCTDADMVPQLQALLIGGADPEHEDHDGTQVYAFAAQILEDPFLSKVMQVLVNGIRGRYVRIVEGKAYTWAQGIFPVSEIQTYDKVVSCTKEDGEFILSMKKMVPQDVQPAFQSAYFAIASELYFEATVKAATSRPLSSRERKEIVSMISMRNLLGLPEHKFNQGLILALLDCQAEDPIILPTQATLSTAPGLPTASPAATTTSPAYKPFQFNSDRPAITRPRPAPSASPSPPETSSDFFIASTTQIRWHDPCSSKPTDLAKAVASVLHYECNVCADGTLLTTSELARHEIEHAHSQACDGWACSRRFCSASASSRKRKRGVGCQDHLFASVL